MIGTRGSLRLSASAYLCIKSQKALEHNRGFGLIGFAELLCLHHACCSLNRLSLLAARAAHRSERLLPVLVCKNIYIFQSFWNIDTYLDPGERES